MMRLLNEGKITELDMTKEMLSPVELLYYAGRPKTGIHVDLATFRSTQGSLSCWEEYMAVMANSYDEWKECCIGGRDRENPITLINVAKTAKWIIIVKWHRC